MTDQCQYLEYRPLPEEGGDGGSGETEDSGADEGQPRAYCTAAEEFVQPMRADICNRRYGLDPETDCEIYRDHEGLPEMPEESGVATDDAGGD